MKRRRGDDEGSVLLLVLGSVVVLAMLLAVVVDTGRLYLTRRSLDSVTDAAALAGAQAVDLAALYEGRDGRDLALDEDAVEDAVLRHLELVDARSTIEGFAVDEIAVGSTEVTVRTRARVRLPFVGAFASDGRATITTSATARNRLADP